MRRARMIEVAPAFADMEATPLQKDIPIRYNQPVFGRKFVQPVKEKIHTIGTKMRDSHLDKKALGAAAVTGIIFTSACSAIITHNPTPPDTYVSNALNGAVPAKGQTTEVGPITAGDIVTTNVTCTVTEEIKGKSFSEKYHLDKLGGTPYIIIFIPEQQQDGIFKTVRGKGTVFLHKSINLNIAYVNQAKLDKNCPEPEPFLASVASVSS